MNELTIHKSTTIQASPSKVWEIIASQPYIDEWLQEIAPGASAEGEVVEGGTVLFYLDKDKNGLKGTYSNVVPSRSYALTFTTELKEGIEVEGKQAEPSLIGASERYLISEDPSGTYLEIKNELPNKELVAQFEPLWDSALSKIKSLAERS